MVFVLIVYKIKRANETLRLQTVIRIDRWLNNKPRAAEIQVEIKKDFELQWDGEHFREYWGKKERGQNRELECTVCVFEIRMEEVRPESATVLRGEFYEYCCGYDNDECLLVALNCIFRERLAESLTQWLAGLGKNYHQKTVNIYGERVVATREKVWNKSWLVIKLYNNEKFLN